MGLIDANELLDRFSMDDRDQFHVMQTCDIIDTIERVPTVDTVRHGHWMLRTDGPDEDFSIMYQCSACRGTAPKRVLYEYCPMCGARMDDEVTE